MATTPILILDNGAYSIKSGISGIDWEPKEFPNSIARSRTEKKIYIADEISQCRDLSGIVYRRPFAKGMLVNWDAEKIIWDRVFSPAGMNVNTTETSLLVTEPYFNLPNIAETYDQMIFEEWEFTSYFRCTPLFASDTDPAPECTIVVDVGYSYTHVVPLRDGQIIWEHVKRIDIGGKLLTNYLKHLISFRQWNMIDQTAVVNDVREACEYVSMSWKEDLETCKRNPRKNDIVQEYVLPDFTPGGSSSSKGYIRSGPNAVDVEAPSGDIDGGEDVPMNGNNHGKQKNRSKVNGLEEEEEQLLYMGNERFSGPELLFNPSDIDIKQSGLPETIAYVISQMPVEVQGMYWAHIGIFGGLGNIEALGERLERDLRSLCPMEYEIGIYEDFSPALPPYQSAHELTTSPIYLETYPVTRTEYLEHGSNICRRRFGGPEYNVNPPGFDTALSGGVNEEMDDDERERRYAMGLERKRGKSGKGGGKKREEEEVISGNWGGRRRRAMGML